jgi:site-specific DNA-methyltransferase (adenine-specific)
MKNGTVTTKVVTGPGWELRLGDCLDPNTGLASLERGSVSATIADPPYSSGGLSSGARARSTGEKYSSAQKPCPNFPGDNRDQRSFTSWAWRWLAACRDASSARGRLAVFTDWRQLPAITDAIQWADWIWRGTGAWAKPLGASRPRAGGLWNGVEFIPWASAGPMPQAGQSDCYAPCLPGLFQAAAPKGAARVHQTQKPDEVLERLVELAPPGDLVCDPFAGSGTTGVAAIRRGRRFVGWEKSPEIFEVACSRLRAARPQ